MCARRQYEIAFMTMIVKHHRTAIWRSRRCQAQAYHCVLVGLCESMIDAQLLEIRKMKTWLCRRYGICRRHAA
jgi:uncharacterized protein (DUF305 family)